MHSLNLIADIDAAEASDALGIGADQRKLVVPLIFGKIGLIRIIEDVEVVCDRLELAVAASDAGRALAVVLGKKELDIIAAGSQGAGRIGQNLHALAALGIAGGDKTGFALDLDHADTAGADFVYFFKIAKGGNEDTVLQGCL